MRWLFFGAGNMASSLIGGLLGGSTSADCIAVVDPDQEACLRAEKAFGIISAPSIDAVMAPLFANAGDDKQLGILIAVKPQIVKTVCAALTNYLNHEEKHQLAAVKPLYISVAAGVTQGSMQRWLPDGSAIVRCMPNTPALLGLGATALHANAHCAPEHRSQAELLMNSCGVSIWVEQESALDAVTAVSGSGPAYFFYLIEHMISAGTKLGLPVETAETLAVETAYGAASMARQRIHSAAVLRENVTSKGGTTAAALNVFNDNDTPATIHAAIKASHQRAVELGKEFEN